MATIAGSHYDATASLITYPGGVNVVETSTGTGLSAAIPTDFNLEVYTGPAAGAPTVPFSGYQGLAILGPGGYTIDVIGSGYAITDGGNGDTLTTDSTATGDTIIGGDGFSNLILNGTGNTANGGIGGNYIEVDGSGNTVNTGPGPTAVNVNSDNDTVNVGSGNSTITISGNHALVTGGTGSDTITALGNNETIAGGTGPELINATGTGTSLTAGSGNDTLNVFGAGDTITAGSGSDVLGAYANNVDVIGGSGPATVITSGTGDTVTAGSGNLNVTAAAGTVQFNDNNAAVYNDTVVGFSNGGPDSIHLAAGDTVATTALVNSNQDTLITLSDHSTILLKGVTDLTGLIH